MVTLAINTSTQPETIALLKGGKILGVKIWHGNMDETKKLLPSMVQLLKRFRLKFCEIGRIVVASGPGGFSALRIGVTVANTLAGLLKIPLFSIPTPHFQIPFTLKKMKRIRVVAPQYGVPPNITKSRHAS